MADGSENGLGAEDVRLEGGEGGVANITDKSIYRLCMYKNALKHFHELGFEKVFSLNLGNAVGVTSAQVRKDFSTLRIFGRRKGGYAITPLVNRIHSILGKEETQKAVLAGVGNIGSALLKYRGFEREQIAIEAAFDIDPSKVGRKGSCPVYPLGELEAFVQDNGIRVGIIAVPESEAPRVFEMMKRGGILGILNFSPAVLPVGESGVAVTNVNLVQELEKLFCLVRRSRQSVHSEVAVA